MAESKTEKQKVQEITEKLEQGIKELFESEKYKTIQYYLSFQQKLLSNRFCPKPSKQSHTQVKQGNTNRKHNAHKISQVQDHCRNNIGNKCSHKYCEQIFLCIFIS